ncbi:hypothetical protein [Fodinicola feengrottensis]|uniref:hypothetical protein n=1 Tax=Fodinicola feengrottensis TaxID=435914 RepID=UPI0013D52FF6|nr:hypothetical protein [Fodinicola feengrottensis]
MTTAVRSRAMAPVIVALAIDMVGTGIFLPVSLLYFIVVAGIPPPAPWASA